jgi:hypothetical protein
MTDCESHSHTVVAAIGQPTIPPRIRAVDLFAADGVSDEHRGADRCAGIGLEPMLFWRSVLCARRGATPIAEYGRIRWIADTGFRNALRDR